MRMTTRGFAASARSSLSFGGCSVRVRSRHVTPVVAGRRSRSRFPRDGGGKLRPVQAKTQLHRRRGDILPRISRGCGTQEKMVGRDRKEWQGYTRPGVSVFTTFSAELFRGLDPEGRRNSNLGFDVERVDRGGPVAAGKAIMPAVCETDYSKTAGPHAVGGGDAGDTADQVRALPEERQLGRDLESAGGGEDRLGSGDGGAEGGQR